MQASTVCGRLPHAKGGSQHLEHETLSVYGRRRRFWEKKEKEEKVGTCDPSWGSHCLAPAMASHISLHTVVIYCSIPALQTRRLAAGGFSSSYSLMTSNYVLIRLFALINECLIIWHHKVEDRVHAVGAHEVLSECDG